MVTKEDVVAYFRELSYNNCNECPFEKECSLLIFDADDNLCSYIKAYAN